MSVSSICLRWLLLCAASLGVASAQNSWSPSIVPGAPFPSDLLLTSNLSGSNQFDFTLGAGGSLVRVRASRESNKEMIPYGTSPTAFNAQWSINGPVAFDDADATTDDRFILNQAGTSNPWLAPMMQVEKNPQTHAVDVYSVPQDQWNPGQQAAVKTKFSSLVRYEPQPDGSIKVRRIIRFGDVTVNGSPWTLATPFYESQNSYSAANFNMLATSVGASGNILTSYTRASDIPQNQQTDATQTTGYAVVYNSTNVTTSAAMGIVFGKQPMAGANPCVVNFSDDATAISVRPGIQLASVSPGAILDVTSYLVPSYGVNSALAGRLSALVAATPAPVLYPAGTTFTGELATIVQRLNDNLALKGIRTDRLGHDVTPNPVSSRPMLLCSPAENADIIARLAAFPQTPESLLNNYLSGSAAQKQAATTYFFRYPGSGDGNGLRTNYNTITARHMMWDQYRYDIALGLGYATEAQKNLMLSLTESFISSKSTYINPDGVGGGNLALEAYIAIGLAGLNFPDHPNAQFWISRSVTNVKKIVDTYFPDGAGTESPRYHDWTLEQLAIFLPALQRRVGIDLYDEPGIRSALEWLIRFSSPPVSLTSNKSVTPAWGDSTYSSNAGTHYYYNLGLFAPYYRQRDPDFSARLMGWWNRNGRPRDVYSAGTSGISNILLLDARLPDAPIRPNTSTYSPRIGHATLRAGTGTNDEFFASFKCGTQGAAHQDGDIGQIDLFAFGVPLALDSTSGPYDSVAFNPATAAHNSVRFNGAGAWDSVSGSFSAFGTSPSADYAVGNTKYGTVSNRHLVMMKGDYLVVWDETTASNYADWFFRVPGTATLEWQPHKVISSTPWGVNLDVHFVLPAEPLIAPTFSGNFIPTGDATALRNQLASQATDPAAPGMFTMMGENRFGDGSTTRNPFPFQWLKYFSVRNGPDRFGDFLTVLHPRKVGVTPEITTELVSQSATAVTLRVTCNGRVDTIALTSTGATITKGNEPPVQFSKSWPQSGVSGAAGYVKSDFYTAPVTTLTSALTTTGPVEVHTGELALGAANRIPNAATLMVKPGAAFNTATFSETVGTLIMNGGVLKGSGTLTASSIEWWGGIVTAPVSATGNFVKKGGTDWSRPANLSYSGDTVIESGNLVFKSGASTLPGTGRVVLRNGTGLKLDGTSASITGLDVTGSTNLTTGAATLSITSTLTGTGVLANSGNLNLSAVSSIANTLTLQSNGLLTLPGSPLTVKRLILNGVTLPAGVAVSAATHPGQIAGTGIITPLEDIPVPTGLSGSASLGQISLTWNAVPGVPGYTVRRSTTPGGPYTDIATPTAASSNDTLVTDAVVYYYVVAARDATGFSGNSAEISVTAIGPWYFDPNGTTAGSVANGGSYDWITSSWTKTPGGTATTEAWGSGRHAHFAATNPGSPLAYSVSLASFNGASHDIKSLRVANGTVTFTGAPPNFYFKQPVTITADAGTQIRFAQTGSWAFNLNLKTVTFDGAGTTLVSPGTPIVNIGNITKSGSGTLVIASPCTYTGTTTINGGTLRLATTDLPTLWLDATKSSSLTLADGAASQWTDANGKPTFVSQSTAANRPTPITDNTLAGPAKTLMDFGAFNATNGRWMQMDTAMTDIRALFWVGKTTNANFLLASTATDYHFHSAGAGAAIWSTQYTSTNIRNGTTWLNGTQVDGTATNMPSDLVRIAAFTTGNVNANTLGRDRTVRYGGIQPGEVMVFNTVLTPQQQTDIEAYLAKKWSNTGTGIGNRLPTSTTVSLSNGATFDLTGINFQTIAALEANDNTSTRVELGAAELTINGSTSSSFDGIISGNGSLRKAGPGNFTLESANTYSGPTTVEAGTLVVENSITSNVTVKSGATLVNNGTITGDVIMENGATYLGEGTISGTITTNPPVVTITSPSADNIVISDLTSDLNLSATIAFNSAFGTPVVTWSMVSGPGTVTFENPNSASTTARFSTAGTYTLRCSAVATVNGQVLQGTADRVVRPGGPLAESFTATFRQGENGYSHAATFIRGDTATWNSGARDQFLIGRNNSGAMRGLFAFDLSSVPSNATVTSAAFDLWIPQVGVSTVNAFELRPLLKDFIEGTGNSISSASVGAGTGADWNSRTGPTTANLWGTAGGQSGTDFSTTVIGSLAGFDATAAATVGTKLGFTLNPAFVTEANAAISAARPLRFMLTMATDTTGSNRFARFASDDHATLSQRPQLTLTYSIGFPALPTLTIGSAPTAVRGVAANLTGSVSNATGGSLWSVVSSPGNVNFTLASSPNSSVTFDAPGIYLLRLSATNPQGVTSKTLSVTVAQNSAYLADWQSTNWPGISDDSITGPQHDPDSDGLPNLAEWALHLNPKQSSPFVPTMTRDGDFLLYTYTRRKVAPGQCSFHVESSETLSSDDWSELNVSPSPPVSIDDTRESVTCTIPLSSEGRRFIRLRIQRQTTP